MTTHPTGDAPAASERGQRRREVASKNLAMYFCTIAGIERVDSTDGSPNWWMFLKDAEKVYDDIVARFPPAVVQ